MGWVMLVVAVLAAGFAGWQGWEARSSNKGAEAAERRAVAAEERAGEAEARAREHLAAVERQTDAQREIAATISRMAERRPKWEPSWADESTLRLVNRTGLTIVDVRVTFPIPGGHRVLRSRQARVAEGGALDVELLTATLGEVEPSTITISTTLSGATQAWEVAIPPRPERPPRGARLLA